MKKQCLFIFSFILLSSYSIAKTESSLNSATGFFAQNTGEISEDDDLNVYNPSIDYLDFQQSEEEKEKELNFFKDGRLLSVMAFPAYRYFFPEQSLSPYMHFGGGLNHFVNLNVSIQFSFTFGAHNLINQSESLGQSVFNTLYADIKFYWNRDRLVKLISYFNPYIFMGGIFGQRSTTVYFNNNSVSASAIGFGGRAGLGIEIHLSQKVFLGTQLSYEYISFRNRDKTDGNSVELAPGNFLYLPLSSVFSVLFLGANF